MGTITKSTVSASKKNPSAREKPLEKQNSTQKAENAHWQSSFIPGFAGRRVNQTRCCHRCQRGGSKKHVMNLLSQIVHRRAAIRGETDYEKKISCQPRKRAPGGARGDFWAFAKGTGRQGRTQESEDEQ